MRWCVLGNSSLYLGFDKHGLLQEMFWPVVGLSNHIGEGARYPMILWYHGRFYDIGDRDWTVEGSYGSGMSFNWSFTHKTMPFSLWVRDCIDPFSPLWARSVTISCSQSRDFGIFFRQYYNLGENNIGECGFWDSSRKRLYHYKGSNWVGIEVVTGGKARVEQSQQEIQVSLAGSVAKIRDGGVYLAQDTGDIHGRTIDHGLIESVYGVKCNEQKDLDSSLTITYFVALGQGRDEVDQVLDNALSNGFEGIHRKSLRFWTGKLGYDDTGSLYDISIKIITTHCDSKGGILASCDTDIMTDYKDHYRYVWPRDAAMSASALIRAGMPGYGQKFLEFCVKILSKPGFFWQRYRPDGTRGSSWHEPDLPEGEYPIQEDQVALSLVTALDYVEAARDIEFAGEIYHSFVKKGAGFIQDYLAENGRLVRPSFDLWEERRGIFTFTQAVSALALMSGAKLAWTLGEEAYSGYLQTAFNLLEGCVSVLSDENKGFCRGVSGSGHDIDWTEDASLFLIPLFIKRMQDIIINTFPGYQDVHSTGQVFEALKIRSISTWTRLEKALTVSISGQPGGIARYSGDWYQRPVDAPEHFPGNPWFVTTGWYVMSGLILKTISTEQAFHWLDWFRQKSLESGVLSEQLNGLTGTCLSVAPLIWSHSTYVDLANLIKHGLQ